VTTGHLLVIGAGQAGAQLVTSVREHGWTGPITLIGSEPHPPYERPPLSKTYLRDSVDTTALALRSDEFYRDQKVDVVLGQHIDRLTLSADGGTAATTTGRQWQFDRLALATGAQPRHLPVPGAELDGIVVLRDISDADALATHLRRTRDLVVIGGGFVGLEVAATAAARVSTTVVEAAPALLTRVVSTETAAAVHAAHAAQGIRILTGSRPVRFHGANGKVTGVELADGTLLTAGLVLVAVGARPRDDLARAAGLHCDGGVVVDQFSMASDGRTIAIGDCANLPDPSPTSSGLRLRLESVDNAVEQARAAATTLVGDPRPYRGVPWFWSHQGKLKLQIAGLAVADDDVLVRPGKRPGQQTVLRYREDRLVAVECLDAPGEFLALRKALAESVVLTKDRAADTSVPLKGLLRRVSEVVAAGEGHGVAVIDN
jgi:3-phenylpropionate/trans-cinnamate dioxygenase ferredoxin reductase subunit